MPGTIALSLIQNTAILLSFAMLYDYFWAREGDPRRFFEKILAGLVVGGIGLVLMQSPWIIAPGMIFDTRSILLSVSGLFFGAVPTLIAIAILGIARILIGGAGMWMGLSVIITSGVIGVLWGKFRPSWRERHYLLELLAMGFLVHLVMVTCTLLLPKEHILTTLKNIALPIVFIYSPGTMLLGLLMVNRATNWKNKKSLYETRALYASLVEHMPAGVFRKTRDGRFDYVNARFCALKGLTENEILGKRPDELSDYENAKDLAGTDSQPPRQKTLGVSGLEHHDWILCNGKPVEVEEVYPQNDGSLEYFQVVKTPIFDMDGQVVGTQGMQFDITLQKKLQSELMVAMEKAEESDRLKTAFLHNISHEIRTPMNAIVGFSDFLRDIDLAPEKRTHYVDVIIQSSNQLLSIIDDIVRIATIEAGQEKLNEENVQINTLCRLVYDQFAEKANTAGFDFQMKLGLPDAETGILSDKTKIQEILSNLLVNALKFTNQGHIYFGYTLKETELEFYVEDTGVGIPEEMKDEIFKRFRQVDSALDRQFGGSGLGLSICKAYIELLGGRIWVSSQPGMGSTFYFTLPYRKALVTEIPVSSMKDPLQRSQDKNFTILIAEDEDFNFILLGEILSPHHVVILRAINGAEAVDLAKTKEDIDLILMDLKMPVMDGYEATKQIKGIRPGLPIIALTAYSQDSDRGKALYCGCSDFISKPFDRSVLIEKISRQLNQAF